MSEAHTTLLTGIYTFRLVVAAVLVVVVAAAAAAAAAVGGCVRGGGGELKKKKCLGVFFIVNLPWQFSSSYNGLSFLP